MALSGSRIDAVIAVSDVSKAKEFYGGKLGLSGGVDDHDGGTTYTLGEGTKLHIYPSADNAGSSTATVAAFQVEDIEAVVDELIGNGVTFEQYDEPLKTNEKGIGSVGEERVAWFTDPDGNILAIGDG